MRLSVDQAVFENMDLKRKIFAELDRVCKPGRGGPTELTFSLVPSWDPLSPRLRLVKAKVCLLESVFQGHHVCEKYPGHHWHLVVRLVAISANFQQHTDTQHAAHTQRTHTHKRHTHTEIRFVRWSRFLPPRASVLFRIPK